MAPSSAPPRSSATCQWSGSRHRSRQASCSRPAVSRWSRKRILRLAAAHPGGTATASRRPCPSPTSSSPRLRGAPYPRRRSLRGCGPPRAGRRRTRLPRPRVRGDGQAVRPDGAGRHGGEVPRRGRPAPPSARGSIGRARPRASSARSGHGRRAGRLYTARMAIPGHAFGHVAVAARARGRVPARGDARTRSPRSTR